MRAAGAVGPLRVLLWRRAGRLLVMACLLLALALAGAAPCRGETIVVGSKNFTENRFLAEVMAQLIEARTDLRVDRRLGLGGTTVVFTALRSGEIDLYPEYTGTGWVVHLGRTERATDPLFVYLECVRQFEERFAATWLTPFGFANSYALAVRTPVARRWNLTRISDLPAHQEEIRAGVSHEFLERPDGFPGLAADYGLRLSHVRGMEHGLAYQAIAQGGIDLIDTWTTDGKLLRYDVRILADDRKFFPPYHAAPVVRLATLARHPALRGVLDQLGYTIDDARMRRLNARIEDEGGTFATVAHDFLLEEGLLTGEASGEVPAAGGALPRGEAAGAGGGSERWLTARRLRELGRLTLEHMVLTAVAVALAILLAVPLGVLLTRRRRAAGLVLGAAGVIQTIPSLALLAFMIPLPGLGLGVRSAIAALFLYALLPILRNTYTGIREVDPVLREAARGMGLTDGQILTRVELPLAVSTIMAGVRTSAVISIGVATLAAFIGAGGLGEPIVTGLQLNDMALVLSGAVPAALLAMAADFILGRVEAALAPRR